MGLAVAGAVSLGATYLATVVMASWELASCCTPDVVAINYLPVIGPIVHVAAEGRDDFARAFYLPSALIQAVTFTMTLAGLIIQRPSGESEGGSSGSLTLTGGPGDAGLGLRATW